MYYTYMLRCEDNSIYTGMTNDLNKRMNDHFSKNKQGAKYTKSHTPIKIEVAWSSKDKSLACKLEYQIKQLSKFEKEQLLDNKRLSAYFSGILDCRKYRIIKIENLIDKNFIKI